MSKKYLLLTIFFLALAVRFYGLNYGLPFEEVFDEEDLLRSTLDMGRNKLNPGYTIVPHFMFNLTFPALAGYYAYGKLTGEFSSPKAFAEGYFRDITSYFLIGRGMSALASALTVVFLAYFLWVFFGRRAALIGSLIFIFYPLDVEYAHLIRFESFLNLCGMGAIYFSYCLLNRREWRYFCLAGLWVGLTFGTKFNGAVYGLFYLLGYLLGVDEWPELFTKKELLKFSGGLFMILVGFFLSSPYCLIGISETWEMFKAQYSHVSETGHLGFESVNGWLYYLIEGFPQSMTWPLEILTFLGMGIALYRHKKYDLFFLIFTILFFLYLGKWKTVFPRYYYPLIIPFIVFMVIAIEFIIEKVHFLRENNLFIGLFLTLILAWPVCQVTLMDYYYTQPSTRLIAKEWIEANIPVGSKIAMEEYGPHITPAKKEYEKRLSRVKGKGKTGLRFKYLVEHYDESTPNYDWEYIWKAEPPDPVAYLLENNFAYAIINERKYQAVYHQATQILHPEFTAYYRRYYDYLLENYKPLKVFTPASPYALGSKIIIFKIK